ncbi:MAG: hypothetical protein ACTHZI_01710 [Luteimonas sp.]
MNPLIHGYIAMSIRCTHPFRASLLAAALATALPLHAIAQHAPEAGQAEAAPANLPAGPLGRSLGLFASQRGIAVSFDPALTEGLQAPALRGRFGNREGLERLLAGSGLQLVARSDGSYALAGAAGAGSDVIVTPVLEVGGGGIAPLYGGTTALDRNFIETRPAGNADIGSLLTIHPAVRHDDARRSGMTPGEISPAEISIHGAHFYQNAFIVDGVNFNNDIDPAQEGTPYRLFAVPGTSQGQALDTNLLESVTVFDHNISAAYGGFNGGVVEATTRRPGRELSGNVAVQSSRSSWTRYHVDERLREDFDSASSWSDGHPEFEKTFIRASLEGYVSDNVGLLFGYSGRRSTIPTHFYSSHLVEEFGQEKVTQERRIDNYLLKGVWHASERLDIEASVTHAPERNQYFRSNIRGGDIDIVRDGSTASFKADLRTGWGSIGQTLGWSRTELSRDPDSDDYMSWQRSESKDWGTNNNTLEGEFGHIEQQMDRLSYALEAAWDPIQWGRTEHSFLVGGHVERQDTHYARLTENSTYVLPRATDTCTNSAGVTDTLACSMGTTVAGWPGQFLSQRTRYATGEIAFNTTSWGAYVEDDIRWERLRIRPGVRLDDDSYMHQTTVAPRLAVSWELTDRGNTMLHAGANRYYGRNVAAWRLQEGIDRLRHNAERRASLDEDWTVGIQPQNSVKFRELDIAYSDELSIGFSHRFGNDFSLRGNVVNRKGRDQVIQVSGDRVDEDFDDPLLASNFTTWTNDGRSESNTYSLQAASLRSFEWGPTSTSLIASLSYLDIKYASPTYFSSTDGNDYYDNPIIQYRGDFIRYADRPMENFNRPWTANVSTTTRVPAWRLTWTNSLGYRSGHVRIAETGFTTEYEGVMVDVWDEVEFGSSITWDMRLGWELPLAGTQRLFTNVDIFNVLDRVSVYGTSNGRNYAPYYETGRSFWLEVGYAF